MYTREKEIKDREVKLNWALIWYVRVESMAFAFTTTLDVGPRN